MEIILASTVLAALVTSLVNLRLATINARSAKELEAFKQDLALEVGRRIEEVKVRARTDETAFGKLWELRSYLKTNNISSLVRAMGPITDDSFTKLCLSDLPALLVEHRRRIDECSLYLKPERIASIESADRSLREKMKALASSTGSDAREKANEMLRAFAYYNETVDGQLDEACARGLEPVQR